MPGTFNPVSGNPVARVSHSKSFRTLLGFGSNSNSGSSIKPSFFSQLNLKTSRKSFGGPPDLPANDHPVLVIDPEPDYGRMRQENRVVLNDDTDARRPEHMPSSSSPSKETSNPSRHKVSHSLPASPLDTHIPSYSLNSHPDLDISLARGSTLESRVDPDNSGLSKHLPDLSTDLSLLMDEQLPPDTTSQSDHPDSQVSAMNLGSSNSGPYQAVSTIQSRSPTKFERHDQTLRGDFAVHEVLTPANASNETHELSKSGFISSSVDASMETTTSFDLSSARLSLDLMRQGFGEDWARSVMVESSSVPSADTSDVLPPKSSLVGSDSGPVTSTPFRSPSASPSGSQRKEPEVSFNLDALDPDLVALLRPSNVSRRPSSMSRNVTRAPSESFAPPPDPLNPGTTAKRSVVPAFSSSYTSPASVANKRDASTPSPIRKFATISASQSPTRQLRLPRSHTAQDIFPRSKLPKPIVAPPASVDLHWKEDRRHDDEQLSPVSAMTYSEILTPSDASKQPSPLSATPLTLDDLQRDPASNAMQSPIASTSTLNVTTRRKGRPAPIQSPSPVSTMTSSVDSRPSSYAPRSHDRDFRPTSTTSEVHALYPHTYGSVGRERDRIRPSLDGLFSKQPGPDRGAVRPSSADAGRPPSTFHERLNGTGVLSYSRDRDWESSVAKRYRKRSMSLDQRYSGVDRRADDSNMQGLSHTRFRGPGDRDGLTESLGHSGSDYAYSVTTASGLGTPYDGRDIEKDREPYVYGYGYGERERSVRPHTDWLGPRTVKAFAAAGLLDDTKDAAGSRYGAFSRSTSDRDLRTPGSECSRDRRSPVHRGHPSLDLERDRYSLATSGRSSDRDFKPSGARPGAVSPSTMVSARPLSRNESWSHSRPAPLFARTMSELMCQRGSADSRDSASGVHPRTGSAYSVGGGGTAGGSTGSGGGRASPTTTSSHFAVQSQIQTLKEKHDAQTEALLAALADSQRTTRELKEENDVLKSQVRSLEERLVDTIANLRQREKDLSRAMRIKRISSPDRTRTAISHRDSEFSLKSRPTLPKPPARLTTSPTKRRFSTTSSVFPTIPGSMSLLMAETPGSPLHSSFGSGSGSSPPPSPTLVLPKLPSKQKLPERQPADGEPVIMSSSSKQPVTISHKRSASGGSVATSTNFSFETGSPGSLKLRPEHELLLGDMTRLSLVTGFDGDSEAET